MNTKKGFTLVELLAVASLMVLLSALVIPALQTTTGPLLTTSGSRLSTLLESARQTAILTRQPVAVAMLPADASSVQRFTALEYSPTTSNWKQIAKWSALPPGILAVSGTETEASGASYTTNAFQPSNSPAVLVSSTLPKLTYAGVNYLTFQTNPTQGSTSYGYVIFLPDGSLYHDSNGYPSPSSPCIVRLLQGISDQNWGVKQYTGPKNSSGAPANYFDIVLNDATGQVKIVRP